MDAFESCCMLVPAEIRAKLVEYPKAEELRLRLHRKPSILLNGKELEFADFAVGESHILCVLERATGASMHSAASSISKGYINYNGLRIGICGQAIVSNGQLIGFRKYSSISIRIPHQLQVIPEEILQGIMHETTSTLIAAPPGVGKTTALRDLVRIVSDKGVRVALVDEKGELSGGAFCFSLGTHTDLISDMHKADAALIMLKTMNPDVIAMDEITSAADLAAVSNINGCGVSVFATAHGKNREDMLKRPIYRKMFEEGIFRQMLTISMLGAKREYKLERISS